MNREETDDQEMNKRVTKARRMIARLNGAKASQKEEDLIYMKQ